MLREKSDALSKDPHFGKMFIKPVISAFESIKSKFLPKYESTNKKGGNVYNFEFSHVTKQDAEYIEDSVRGVLEDVDGGKYRRNYNTQ